MINAYALESGFSEETFSAFMAALHASGISDIWLVTGKPIWGKLHGNLVHLTNRVIQDSEIRIIVTWIYGANAVTVMGSAKPIDERYTIQLLHSTVDRANEISNVMGLPGKLERSASQNKRLAFRFNGVSGHTPKGRGFSLSLRSIPLDLPLLDDMGLPPALRSSFSETKGVTLVVGETGSGKSTLLAALMHDKLLNSRNRHIITIENPIEFDLQGVRSNHNFVVQHEIGPDLPSFYCGIVNSLRQAPTDILVGEARDKESIDGLIAASETGHDTYATVHASSVVGAFRRIANEYETAAQPQIIFKLLSQIRLVVVQVLLIAKAGGRRVPIREWFYFDDSYRDELMRMDSESALNDLGDRIRAQGQTMRQQVLRAYLDDKVSLTEVRKIAGNFSEEELQGLKQTEEIT